MKVAELIKYLNETYSADDSIVVAWWDQDSFSQSQDMDKDEWAKAADYLEDIDWQYTHDTLGVVLDEYLES